MSTRRIGQWPLSGRGQSVRAGPIVPERPVLRDAHVSQRAAGRQRLQRQLSAWIRVRQRRLLPVAYVS